MPALSSKIAALLSRKTGPLLRLFRVDSTAWKATAAEHQNMIARQFQYFNELTPPEKERFLKRVYYFKQRKNFHYIGLEPSPEIPVLISAAAVQITFGLRKYRMPFFTDIYIMADAYIYGSSQDAWVGHVNREGIYISWKHFLYSYSDNHDHYNVGLHEMAHALEYVNFLDHFRADDYFVEHFISYKHMAERVMPKLLRQPSSSLLSEQGRRDFHECWAECAEFFFENPEELNGQFPELYKSIKLLLNQDPLKKIKILDAKVAGWEQ